MGRLTVIALGVFAVVLVFGSIAPATAPLTLTSPDSGSMEPTAPEHSLVVVVSNTPEVGDIALFENPTRNKPVLHRIVGETEVGDGFITQGDGNSYTDQESGDPPLMSEHVYGVVPTIGDQPLIIPYLGSIITNPFIIVGLWSILALSALYSSNMGTVTRGVVLSIPFQTYALFIGLLIIVLLPIAILGFAPTMDTYIITSSTSSSDAAYIASVGETTQHTISLSSPFLLVLHVSAHSDGELMVTDIEKQRGSSTAYVTVTNSPSNEPTIHEGTVTMYTYPQTLPKHYLQALAAVHPALAAFISSVMIGGPLFLLGLLSDPRRIYRADRTTLICKRRSRQQKFKRGDRFS